MKEYYVHDLKNHVILGTVSATDPQQALRKALHDNRLRIEKVDDMCSMPDYGVGLTNGAKPNFYTVVKVHQGQIGSHYSY